MNQVFVDTTAWCALTVDVDDDHERSLQVLREHQGKLVTSDHILVETWAVLRARQHRLVADEAVARILEHDLAEVVPATAHDIQAALSIGQAFADQDFSLVDRTSWAVMERNGITEAVSFDADFSVYRYGPHKNLAFTVYS